MSKVRPFGKNKTVALWILINWGLLSFHVDANEVCQGLILKGAEDVDFSANEKIFLCGDKETPSWVNPPNWQKKIYLDPILQSKGYYNTNYSEDSAGTLVARLSQPTVIRSISIFDFPIDLEKPGLKKFVGEKINSQLLDEIEEILKIYLERRGYPCAQLKTEVFLQSGEVEIKITSLQLQRFSKVLLEKQEQIFEGAITRSYPFLFGQVYNSQLLEIASRRLERQGLLNHSYFSKKCQRAGGFDIHHEVSLIKPRIVRLGGGFNTEKGPLAIAGWKNSRLSKLGSSFEVKLEGSFVEQKLTSTHRWFFKKEIPKLFIRSRLTFLHENENTFEQTQVEASMLPSYTSDVKNIGYSVSAGPQLTDAKIVEGGGLSNEERYALAIMQISWWSHQYEYFEAEPRQGYQSTLSMRHGDAGWGLGFEMTQLDFSFTLLEDFGEPAFENFILGLRGAVTSTIVDNDQNIVNLPANLRVFLGGSENFRGFGRKELPLSTTGGLTGVYAGSEARWNGLMPWRLQPLIFADWVNISSSSLSLSRSEEFWAPGVGLRWQSPIGSFRLTYAHARGLSSASRDIKNDQLFFSYGEEF